MLLLLVQCSNQSWLVGALASHSYVLDGVTAISRIYLLEFVSDNSLYSTVKGILLSDIVTLETFAVGVLLNPS